MSHFSPERELEIRHEIQQWWDDKDWDEKVELVKGEDDERFEILLEFAQDQQKLRDTQEKGSGRWKEAGIVLSAIDDYLWTLAENQDIISDQFGERLTWRRD